MNLTTIYGAALLVLALLALAMPALAFTQHRVMIRKRGFPRFNWLNIARFMASELGTTITYCWPGGPTGNTTTAPTAAAASMVTEQTVKVAMGDTETSAVIVHNWGLPASAPSFLFPLVAYYQDTIGVGPSTDLATLTFDLTNTNQVTITKLNGVGTGGTFRVFLARPHSLIR